MTADFFQAKRPWSKYKDIILRYYLDPYIPKVATLGKPIHIVDCFAGCGRFGDNEPGSPLIIGSAIQRWREKRKRVTGQFIEADPNNFKLLVDAVAPFAGFAEPRLGMFETQIDNLALRAKSESIFLYVDPYTVKALVFERLEHVYQQIRAANASVEVLMNFNVATFMRWALAALKRSDVLPADATNEESDYQADDPTERLEMATLDGIAGGEYWRSIAGNSSLTFAQKLDKFTEMYVTRLRTSFNYACAYPVKSKYEHQTPKYMLIYATRHPDGLELMNDAMCKARREFLGGQFQSGMLFDMTPAAEITNVNELKNLLLDIVRKNGHVTRKDLRIQVLTAFFCRFTQKLVNDTIGDLLKSGKLFSATGRTRINDSVSLGTQPFSKS